MVDCSSRCCWWRPGEHRGSIGKFDRELALWLLRDGSQPYEAKIGIVAEIFSISPAEAEEQDEELTLRAMQALGWRRIADKAGKPNAKLNNKEAAVWQGILDVLDKIDEEAGVPEEL